MLPAKIQNPKKIRGFSLVDPPFSGPGGAEVGGRGGGWPEGPKTDPWSPLLFKNLILPAKIKNPKKFGVFSLVAPRFSGRGGAGVGGRGGGLGWVGGRPDRG